MGIFNISYFEKMFKTSHGQMALATGVSILTIACFTKWVLPNPIDPLLLAIPPLIEATFEGLLKKYKEAKFLTAWYWVCAIILSTALIIVLHLV